MMLPNRIRGVVSAAPWRDPLMAALLFISLICCGCAAAYNSRHDLAPGERHSVECYIRGAYGYRYYSETKKKVVVTIYARGPNDTKLLKEDEENQRKTGVWISHPIPGLQIHPIFEKTYQIRGSSVSWRSSWGESNDLAIVFYDYGVDEAGPTGSQSPAGQRLLRRLEYHFDPIRDNCVEVAGGGQ
jgi:hypothetical protein